MEKKRVIPFILLKVKEVPYAPIIAHILLLGQLLELGCDSN
jgi:hypothetical protein